MVVELDSKEKPFEVVLKYSVIILDAFSSMLLRFTDT